MDSKTDSKMDSKEKKRKDYASQVQLRALRKGPLTSKLARVAPRSQVMEPGTSKNPPDPH
eukprot:1156389-Pelagomonas_calceolata.AAC.1